MQPFKSVCRRLPTIDTDPAVTAAPLFACTCAGFCGASSVLRPRWRRELQSADRSQVGCRHRRHCRSVVCLHDTVSDIGFHATPMSAFTCVTTVQPAVPCVDGGDERCSRPIAVPKALDTDTTVTVAPSSASVPVAPAVRCTTVATSGVVSRSLTTGCRHRHRRHCRSVVCIDVSME